MEDYWERGDSSKTPPTDQILHNLAIYGWDLRDTLSLTATKVRQRIGRASDDVWFPKEKVEDDNDRAALFVLETARGPVIGRLRRWAPPVRWASQGTDHPMPVPASRP